MAESKKKQENNFYLPVEEMQYIVADIKKRNVTLHHLIIWILHKFIIYLEGTMLIDQQGKNCEWARVDWLD